MGYMRLELTEVVYSVNAFDMRKALNPRTSDEDADLFRKFLSDFSKNSLSAHLRQCHDSQYERRCI